MEPIRGHAPLRRTSCGHTLNTISPQMRQQQQQILMEQVSSNVVVPQQQPTPQIAPNPQNERVAALAPTINDFDSCYSSCDDISHPSLSRESSDPCQNEHDGEAGSSKQIMNKPTEELAEFAIKLGYSMDQMFIALDKTGDIGQEDRMLSELLKTGKGASEHVMNPKVTPQSSSSSNPFDQLRSIVIDGSNVAMAHGRREVFSCAGIRDCVRFFVERGHRDINVVIPQYRKEQPRADSPITDQHILDELDPFITYTPSRNINGRRIVCYDDLYILRIAQTKDAVIVSNDEFRDLTKHNPTWRKLVEQRQLMFTIVDDKFVPPDDPMGRYGPRLDQFLSKAQVSSGAQICPYARKCTYGNKCKYYHPERVNGAPSVTDRLMQENQQKKSLSAVKSMQYEMFKNKHGALARTRSLNMVKPGDAGAVLTQQQQQQPQQTAPQPPRQHVQLQQVNSAPWQQYPQHYLQPPLHSHQSVSRNNSMPLSPVNRGGAGYSMMSMEDNTRNLSQTHLYAPSTAVWGHSELSVGPLSTGVLSNDQMNTDARARVQYHLSNLFPETVVEAVMAAHPEEINAQVLCEKILNMGRGFNYPRQ